MDKAKVVLKSLFFEDVAVGTLPGSGIPWRIYGFLTIVQLLWSIVFYSASNFHFLTQFRGSSSDSEDIYQEEITEADVLFIVGSCIAQIVFGTISDKHGRKPTLLLVMTLATVFIFFHAIALWPTLAMIEAGGTSEVFGFIFLYILAFSIGLLNGAPSILLASGLDISSAYTQTMFATLLVTFGTGGPARFAANILDISINALNEQDLLWLLILFAFIFSGILIINFFIVWKLIPETLNADVPLPHDSTISATIEDDQSEILKRNQHEVSSDDSALFRPLQVLYETPTWICFWLLAIFFSLQFVSNFIVAVYLGGYRDGSVSPNGSGEFDPIMLVFVLGMVYSIIFAIGLILVSWKFPGRIQTVGYPRFFFFCAVSLFGVQILSLLLTSLLAIVGYSEVMYAIACVVFFLIIIISITALFVGFLCLLLMMMNNSFRNEGGFTAGFAFTAVQAGIIPIFGIFFWLFDGFSDLTKRGGAPITLIASTALYLSVLAGAYWIVKNYSHLSSPRSQPHEGPTKYTRIWWGIFIVVSVFLAICATVLSCLILFYWL